jgi:nucleoside-diphosphate-sugar epimerase
MWVVGDNAKFRKATGWQPRLDLATGIRQMIEVVRQQRNREPQHAV